MVKTLAPANPSLIRLSPDAIEPTRRLPFPLYARTTPVAEVDVFRRKAQHLTSANLHDASAKGIRLYATQEDIGDAVQDANVPWKERLTTLHMAIRSAVARAFSQGEVDETVDLAKALSSQTGLAFGDSEAALLVSQIDFPQDDSPHSHAARVSMFATAIARLAGISRVAELQQIATGALLADLGKLSLGDSRQIERPLTGDERGAIQSHPGIGMQRLIHRADLSFGQLMMVYQHHERLDGTGYPVRSVGSEIHWWAQICGISDVFVALTSDRTYRSQMTTAKSLDVMQRDCSNGFDERLMQCLRTITNKK